MVGLSVYSWDLWAGTVEWDDRTKAIWGLPPEAEVDLALARSAIHPDDLPHLDASIAQAKDPQGEGIFRVEFRVIGINDGLERWVSSYGKTTFVDGKARGFVGAVREITQEKRAEVRLRESDPWQEDRRFWRSIARCGSPAHTRRSRAILQFVGA